MSTHIYTYLIEEQAVHSALERLRSACPLPRAKTYEGGRELAQYLGKSEYAMTPHELLTSRGRTETSEFMDQLLCRVLLRQDCADETEISARALFCFLTPFLLGSCTPRINDYGSAEEINGSLFCPKSCRYLLHLYSSIDWNTLGPPSSAITHLIYNNPDEPIANPPDEYQLRHVQTARDLGTIVAELSSQCQKAVSQGMTLYVVTG